MWVNNSQIGKSCSIYSLCVIFPQGYTNDLREIQLFVINTPWTRLHHKFTHIIPVISFVSFLCVLYRKINMFSGEKHKNLLRTICWYTIAFRRKNQIIWHKVINGRGQKLWLFVALKTMFFYMVQKKRIGHNFF